MEVRYDVVIVRSRDDATPLERGDGSGFLGGEVVGGGVLGGGVLGGGAPSKNEDIYERNQRDFRLEA